MELRERNVAHDCTCGLQYLLGFEVSVCCQARRCTSFWQVQQVRQVEGPVLVEMHDGIRPFGREALDHLFHITEFEAFED